MDRVSAETRSSIMRRVRSKNTGPELTVRRMLHRHGFRFRLHRSDLPGKPDIVLPKWKAVILVHGCFWHQHPGCPRATRPEANRTFWERKLNRNVERDRRNEALLFQRGWRVLKLWECEIQSRDGIEKKLLHFFEACKVE